MSRTTPALLLVLPIVVVGLAWGRRAALATALAATVVFNVAFLPPFGSLKVTAVDDVVALAAFGAVALAVGTLVSREGRRRRTAEERAAELAQVNEELARVQAERERLAEEATRATVLERIDEQRAALLRSVSHDLRSPLSTIRAVASDLRSGADYDDATRAELLALVAAEAERLDRLVANLLSLSRIEAGALVPERQALPLDELVGNVVKRLRGLTGGKRVQLDLPADLPLVDGDYVQIDQVMSNLVENAARHAPGGSTIRIAARADGGLVSVRVDDEGVGIAPFERQRIFEPFNRGEGSASSGIGLAICKGIVEAHGGTIEASEAPGGGARIGFTLPAREAAR